MTQEIANAISGYVETLYKLNTDLVKLCGTDVYYGYDDNHKLALDIIQNIPRLIPYGSISKNNTQLEIKDRDGLIEFDNTFNFLKKEYNLILTDNYNTLDKIKKIRNKYEHILHKVKCENSGNGSMSLFEYGFDVDGLEINIYSIELINLVKEINILFSKIVNEVKKYAVANEKENYRYYQRMMRFDFTDFNDIYDCELIKKIGIIMNEY